EASMKFAVTLLAASIFTLQLPVPVQAPDQPLNLQPVPGVAVTSTSVPAVYFPVDDDGRAPTNPVPFPFIASVSGNSTCATAKLAVTLLSAFIVTLQAPVPVQVPPDQPVN